MNKNPIKERLDSFIRQKGYSRRTVKLLCGFKPTYLATLSGKIPGNKLDKIQSLFPDLNTEWLNTGEGCMCLDASYLLNRVCINDNGRNIMKRIHIFLEYKKISIKSFERDHNIPIHSFESASMQNKDYVFAGWASIILDDFPELSSEWLLRGKGTMLKPKHTVSGLPDVGMTIGINDKAEVNSADKIIRMTEQDMSPVIKYNDLLLCKQTFDCNEDISPIQRRLAWNSYSIYCVYFKDTYTVKDVVVTEDGKLLFFYRKPSGEKEFAFTTDIMNPEIEKAFLVVGIIRKGID